MRLQGSLVINNVSFNLDKFGFNFGLVFIGGDFGKVILSISFFIW